MRKTLQSVPTVPPDRLSILRRAALKTTGIDPGREGQHRHSEVYTVRAITIWIAVTMLGFRKIDMVGRFVRSKSTATYNVRDINHALARGANVKWIDHWMVVEMTPKIYAEYCRLCMVHGVNP